MVERLILTVILVLAGLSIFYTWRYAHMKRINRTHPASTGSVGQLALLYFRSDSCAPCRTQSYYLQTLEEKFDGQLTIRKINVDVEPEVASRYGVFTLPTTLIVNPEGQVRHINYGLIDAVKLAQQLENNR